jgi:hypothetical protein
MPDEIEPCPHRGQMGEATVSYTAILDPLKLH